MAEIIRTELDDESKAEFGLRTIDELALKLSEDPKWRMNNLFFVKDEFKATDPIVKFKMRPMQLYVWNNLWYRTIIPKSRKHGITTLGLMMMLEECITQPHQECGLLAQGREYVKGFMDKPFLAWEKLNPVVRDMLGLGRGLKNQAAEHMSFFNGSTIKCKTSYRGDNFQHLHISEYAFICKNSRKRQDEINSGCMTAVPAGGTIVIESTTEGPFGDFFHKAIKGKENMEEHNKQMKETGSSSISNLDFFTLFLPWFLKEQNNIPMQKDEPLSISPETSDYLTGIERTTGKLFTSGQKKWYNVTKRNLIDESRMNYEHPSTLEEAFSFPDTTSLLFGTIIKRMEEQGRIGEFHYNPAKPVYTFSDLGMDGSAFFFVQEGDDLAPVCIDFVYGSGKVLADYVNVLKDKQDNPPHYKYAYHWSGFDCARRDFFPSAHRLESAAKLGIVFQACDKWQSRRDLILNAFEFMGGTLRIDMRFCKDAIKNLMAIRRRETPGGYLTEEVIKDGNMHTMDALLYMSIAWSKRDMPNQNPAMVRRAHDVAARINAKYKAKAAFMQTGNGLTNKGSVGSFMGQSQRNRGDWR